MKILKCKKCNATLEEMKELVPNSVDAAIEKHVPEYEVKDGMLYVRVNHVMDDDHFIKWIKVESDNSVITTYFNPGEEAVLTFKYVKGAVVYSYCNKHGLWETVVE